MKIGCYNGLHNYSSKGAYHKKAPFSLCKLELEDDHMTGEEIKSMQTQYNLQSWSKQKGLNPVPVQRGEGIYFWDYDGNRYTDMSAQLVNMNLGFGNKAIGDAIKEQVDRFCYVAPSYGAEPRAKLAKLIIELMPDNMGKVFQGIVNNGISVSLQNSITSLGTSFIYGPILMTNALVRFLYSSLVKSSSHSSSRFI
jgi:hypothetical protein